MKTCNLHLEIRFKCDASCSGLRAAREQLTVDVDERKSIPKLQ